MIRFSAALVALALGVLAAGVTTSRLLLIYVAIGASALAFVCLGIGVAVKRGELFGGSSREAGRFDRGPVPVGFAADGFSPADHVSAGFGELPRGARAAAPGQMPRHAFGQSGPAPDARVRVPASPGRPPVDRQEQDWQEPLRAADRRGADVRGADVRGGDVRGGDVRGADVRGSDARAPGNRQPDTRGAGAQERMSPPPWAARPPAPSPSGTQPGGQQPADMRPPGGSPAARTQRPAPFPGESVPATPPFGSPQGPDAARQRQEAPGPSRPEQPRGEPSRPLGEPSRPSAHEREVPRPQAPRPERPAAFSGGAPRPSAPPRPDDIPPPVAPIYPAGKAAPPPSGGQHSQQAPGQAEKAPEPTGPQGWFFREQALDEPAVTSPADDKPPAGDRPAAAGERNPSTEPVAAESAEPGPAQVADSAGSGDAPAAESPGSDDGSAAERQVTIVPGVPRYHRPECILIRFMEDGDLERRSLTSAAETGYEPCRACQPDADGDVADDDAADQAPVGG